VRVLVIGLCLVISSQSASAWMAPAPPDNCDDCCPDGLRPASTSSENCCIAAPERPAAPASVRVTGVTGLVTVSFLPVAPWALATLPGAPPRTAPPPLPPSAVLLRTTVLLI
jgi:hypothetical protein